ncbi:hypothetical protein I316_02253 [Kwoniella heveanensis BCC8398]|uniref:Uncharacterized protein n=1 Tax=Kwoniella heveanensis BCC8398 TaxID=1296120 RepID=A0A1B9GXJ8_9TREE|nr:hypothetical protein I316_02253 [Kwoniella heveanensis BCC8398]
MSGDDGAGSGDALVKARQLMTAAVAPNSTAESRRTFRSHLITLASDPSYEHKAFFGTLVSKFFGEFEDLQDSTIDALLDLCEDEDEKVRIIGIKGLGPTGRADPRWVKGNTGVLLQLLACQPRELKHVRDSLQMLLAVSPIDVLSVMIDDCRGSEEETGASRKNIIEYLNNDAKDFRKELENSAAGHGAAGDGKNAVEVERVFREGFLEVLDRVKGEGEVRMILEMLKDLPSVSGPTATADTKIRYIKAVTRSLPSTATDPETVAPLIQLFVEYIERASPVDPRCALSFVSIHGKSLISLATSSGKSMNGNGHAATAATMTLAPVSASMSARKALQGLRKWVDGALDKWKTADRSAEIKDKDVSEEVIARDFIEVILHRLVTLSRNVIASNGILVEIVLYAIYRLATVSDRRSWISSSDARGLSDIAREASRIERQTSIGSVESKIWRNVTDMAEILSDPRSRITRITSSWPSTSSRVQQQPPPARLSAYGQPSSSAVPPSGPRNDGTARSASMPMRNAPRGPRDNHREARAPPAGPRSTSSRVAGPPNTNKPLPTGPRESHSRAPVAQRPDDRDHTGSSSRASNRQVRAPRSPAQRRSASPSRERNDESRRRETPPKPAPAQTRSPVRPPTPPLPSDSSTTARPAQGLSIRSASQPTTSANASPASTSITKAKSPEAPGAKTVERTGFPATPPVRDNPTSLASRLGVSTSTTTSASTSSPSPFTKRQREEESSQPRSSNERKAPPVLSTDRPSLLSRLSAKDSSAEGPQAKKSRYQGSPNASGSTPSPASSTPVAAKLSLRDRLNGHGPKASPSSPLAGSDANGGSSATLPPTGPKGLSILNRSTSSPAPSPIRPGSGSLSTSSQPKGLSILSRSSQSKSSNVSGDASAAANNHVNSGPDTKPDARVEPESPKRSANLSILRHASSSATDANKADVRAAEAGRLIRERDEHESSAKGGDEGEEEEVIVRKGRGFRAKTPDDIIMAESSLSITTLNANSNLNINGGGSGLAGRIGLAAAGGGGGAGGGSIRGGSRGGVAASAGTGVGLPFGIAGHGARGRGRGLVRPGDGRG